MLAKIARAKKRFPPNSAKLKQKNYQIGPIGDRSGKSLAGIFGSFKLLAFHCHLFKYAVVFIRRGRLQKCLNERPREIMVMRARADRQPQNISPAHSSCPAFCKMEPRARLATTVYYAAAVPVDSSSLDTAVQLHIHMLWSKWTDTANFNN